MKKLVLSAMVVMCGLLLFSCQPYGKKVKINDHLEVYVKGEATEEEGKKLGNYLATLDSSNTNQKSIQLTKEKDNYTVRLVIPEEHLNNKELEGSFQALQYLVKENVFPGKNVKLVLTDNEFNDKKQVQELTDIPDAQTIDSTALPVDTTGAGQ